jgi:SAM-dependent methyltransferase
MNSRNVDWSERTAGYAEEMTNPYHQHRMKVLVSLLPELRQGMRILDFGCGEGAFLPLFIEAGAEVLACDKEEKMIDQVRRRLIESAMPLPGQNLKAAGVEYLAEIPSDSLDGVLAFNVIAYFTPEEEHEFYSQLRRIVKRGGFLAVSHSNMLFDFFSLNRYTLQFFQNHLVLGGQYAAAVESLLARTDLPAGDKALPLPVRENPLTYALKLKGYGFAETRQEFINRHEAPPPVLQQQTFPDTLAVPEHERWKLLFTCSQFASLALRQ